eukprot:88402-Prymnesium_polylepis.1
MPVFGLGTGSPDDDEATVVGRVAARLPAGRHGRALRQRGDHRRRTAGVGRPPRLRFPLAQGTKRMGRCTYHVPPVPPGPSRSLLDHVPVHVAPPPSPYYQLGGHSTIVGLVSMIVGLAIA